MKKFIQKHKTWWLLEFGFYQQKDKIQFGVNIDWSEVPLLICIDILFWEFELGIYTDKSQMY